MTRRKPLRTLLCTTTLVILSGCASMSKDECLNNDMYSKGLADGEAGYAASRLARHQEACGKFGIRLDGATYLAGREEGLKKYCTPSNAEAVGRAGYSYAGVCPPDKEAAFNAAYRRGKLHHDIEGVRKRIADFRMQLSDDTKKLSAAERRRLYGELDQAHADLELLLLELARQ